MGGLTARPCQLGGPELLRRLPPRAVGPARMDWTTSRCAALRSPPTCERYLQSRRGLRSRDRAAAPGGRAPIRPSWPEIDVGHQSARQECRAEQPDPLLARCGAKDAEAPASPEAPVLSASSGRFSRSTGAITESGNSRASLSCQWSGTARWGGWWRYRAAVMAVASHWRACSNCVGCALKK